MAANGRTDRFDRGPANDRNRRDFATHHGLGEGLLSTCAVTRRHMVNTPSYCCQKLSVSSVI